MPAGELFAVHFGLQHTHIGQIAVFFIVVKAIAHHKFIGHLEAQIIGMDIGLAALGLIQNGADLY